MPKPISSDYPPALTEAMIREKENAKSYCEKKGKSLNWMRSLTRSLQRGNSRLFTYQRLANACGKSLDEFVLAMKHGYVVDLITAVIDPNDPEKYSSLDELAQAADVSENFVRSFFTENKLDAIHSFIEIADDFNLNVEDLCRRQA